MRKVILCLILVFNVGFSLDFDKALDGCIVKSDEKSCLNLSSYLEKECENGSKAKCFLFADMLQRGLGVEKDVVRAFDIFNKGCENNVSESCYEASVHYLEGKGTSHSFEESTTTLLKACDLGSKRACQILTYLPQE